MANVQPYEIVCGPCEVWIADTGATFPGLDDAPGTHWLDLGHTEGGVVVSHTQTVNEIRTDQVTAPIKAIRSEEGLEIGFSLAELTLEHYRKVLNNVALTTGASPAHKTIPLYSGGSQVQTFALLVRGTNLSPYGNFHLQYEVPAVFQSESPEVEFTKEDKAVLACQFNAIADPNRSSDEEAFGRLRAATAAV